MESLEKKAKTLTRSATAAALREMQDILTDSDSSDETISDHSRESD